MKRPSFTAAEVAWLEGSSPEALRSLITYHEVRATEADAMGYHESVSYHDQKAKEYAMVADFIETFHNQGDAPPFDNE